MSETRTHTFEVGERINSGSSKYEAVTTIFTPGGKEFVVYMTPGKPEALSMAPVDGNFTKDENAALIKELREARKELAAAREQLAAASAKM